MIQVNSLQEFNQSIGDKQKAYLLIFKKGTGVSDCAFSELKRASAKNREMEVYYADATQVRDIHPHFNVTSAPSLLVFEQGQLKDVIKGCHDSGYYQNLFGNAMFATKAAENPQQKSVTVYSTQTCPWCTTLKNYLKKNGIRFEDVDVSRNAEAARRMVSATGQQGVPQANIGGDWVVGFDQLKIKRLLNIQS